MHDEWVSYADAARVIGCSISTLRRVESSHPETEQWAVFESNVQAHRGLALSAQGLFLAVGAILIDRAFPLVAVFFLAMAATWWVFFPVIFARSAIVDFHKFNFGAHYDREGLPADDETTDFLLEVEYARTGTRTLR